MTRVCMKTLRRNIRRSSIILQTKIRLYNVYKYPRYSPVVLARGVIDVHIQSTN